MLSMLNKNQRQKILSLKSNNKCSTRNKEESDDEYVPVDKAIAPKKKGNYRKISKTTVFLLRNLSTYIVP